MTWLGCLIVASGVVVAGRAGLAACGRPVGPVAGLAVMWPPAQDWGGRDGLPRWTCGLYGHSHCLSGLAAVYYSDEGAQAAVAAGVGLCISMEAVGFATAEVCHDTVSAGQG